MLLGVHWSVWHAVFLSETCFLVLLLSAALCLERPCTALIVSYVIGTCLYWSGVYSCAVTTGASVLSFVNRLYSSPMSRTSAIWLILRLLPSSGCTEVELSEDCEVLLSPASFTALASFTGCWKSDQKLARVQNLFCQVPNVDKIHFGK